MASQVRRVGRHVWMRSIPAASSCVLQVGFLECGLSLNGTTSRPDTSGEDAGPGVSRQPTDAQAERHDVQINVMVAA